MGRQMNGQGVCAGDLHLFLQEFYLCGYLRGGIVRAGRGSWVVNEEESEQTIA